MPEATKIVFGARCAWWDSIDKAATIKTPSGHGLPCCPHCRGVLFEIEPAKWFDGLRQYATIEPGYEAMMLWSRGRCFATMASLRAAYGSRPNAE